MAELNKRFLIKIYNLDGTFKSSASISEDEIASNINYTENINGGQGMLKLLLNRNFNNTDIEKSNFVKVYIYDSNFPTGKLLYTGIIERIKRIYTADTNQVELICLGLGSLLTRLFFEKTSSKVFSENKDPGDIVKDIITYFNSVYTGNWLNDTGVTLLGSSTSVSFDYTTCLKALENLAESAGFYFLIKEDGTVIFQLKQATVTHKFTAGKDLQELVIEEDTQNLGNSIFVSFTTGIGTASDGTSQTVWGKMELLENRSDINLQATADTTASNILAEKKDPKQKVSLKINKNFILENIKPGDNIKILNIDYVIDNKQIQKISYTPEVVTIELEEFESLGKILNK